MDEHKPQLRYQLFFSPQVLLPYHKMPTRNIINL